MISENDHDRSTDRGDTPNMRGGLSSEEPPSDAHEQADQRTLMDTVGEPEPTVNPARAIEEKGEPFEGNHA